MLSEKTEISKTTEYGKCLALFLDQMDVNNKWLPDTWVNWKTGKVIPGKKPIQSHCSAFVAAVCSKLGVSILRPPRHGQVMLANAQFDWLKTEEAKENGWTKVSTSVEAQNLANQGFLVVASYKNKDLGKSGHIAIIRPDYENKIDYERIQEKGPQITQAGSGRNFRTVTLNYGFRFHLEDLQEADKLCFYANDYHMATLKKMLIDVSVVNTQTSTCEDNIKPKSLF